MKPDRTRPPRWRTPGPVRARRAVALAALTAALLASTAAAAASPAAATAPAAIPPAATGPAAIPPAATGPAAIPPAATGPAALAPAAFGQAAGAPGSVAQPASLPLASDLAAGSYQLTLLTGDRVRLTVGADRRFQVDIEVAVRADGSAPSVEWFATGDGLYVVPEDVVEYLDSGLLDEKLFDVALLAASGYAGAAAPPPVIIEYAERGASVRAGAEPAAAASLPGTAGAQVFSSIHAAAVEVAPDQAADFWAGLVAAAHPAGASRGLAAVPAAGIERVWLDRVARLALDESVPLIGAPQAWDAGYDGSGTTVAVLDTGIDAGHPDLAGRLVAGRNFTGDGDPVDGHGHGTHVATTVAGTGAASDGRYRGVAPGADLVIGKVCDDQGNCPTSTVLAGMEWAAREQHADVVNLSLGSCCTDGTDPLSQAVNQLTAETGTLFVIAAGNDGPQPYTVGSPGTADAALTVGSVSKAGQLASTSSRGPRLGDSALKPEITAPGVAIVAGRAAGTSMGVPVGDYYTTESGTSMATPHVAGAAALLAQRHPDWDAEALKAALIATAEDGGYTAYQQGAGRVDAARAVRQQVQVSPAVADFGFQPYPQVGPALTRTLSYRNPTADPVTLTVTGELSGVDGTPVPAGVLRLDQATVAVPAAGTATVTVTLDHTQLAAGRYSGSIVASDGTTGTQLTTVVGLVVGEQFHRMTIEFTARDCVNGVHCTGGFTSFSFGSVRMWSVDGASTTAGQAGSVTRLGGHSARVSSHDGGYHATVDLFLATGSYALQWDPRWLGAEDSRRQDASLWLPEVTITGPTTLSLDANNAVKVRYQTPRPVGDGLASVQSLLRLSEAGTGGVFWGTASAFGYGNYWVLPTEPVTSGTFLVSHQDVFEAPQVEMAVAAPEPLALDPLYPGYRPDGHPHATTPVRFAEGSQTLPVVDVGIGQASDYAGLDAAGKLALVRRTGPDAASCQIKVWQLEAALAAGAAGVIYHPETCPLPALIQGAPSNEDKPQIPYVSLPSVEADRLIELLAAGPVEVTVTGAARSPYTYFLKEYEHGRVPASMDYQIRHDELVVIDASYHAESDGWLSHSRVSWYPVEQSRVTQAYEFAAPTRRTEYWGPADPKLRHERNVWSYGYPELSVPMQRVDVFDRPGARTERWNADPWTPGVATELASHPALCAGCRESDMFWPEVYLATGDPAYTAGVVGVNLPASDDLTDPFAGLRLYRNGEPIPQIRLLGFVPGFPVPPEPGDYRLEMDLTGVADDSRTVWEFHSGPVGGGESVGDDYACILASLDPTDPAGCRAEPLIFLRYDGFRTDLRNQVQAPGAHRFEVQAYRHPGVVDPPAVVDLRLWISDDDGQSWQAARVRPLGEGRYAVTVVHLPERTRASNTVSIRVEAIDAAGNRVEQVLPATYQLTSRGANPCRPNRACH